MSVQTEKLPVYQLFRKQTTTDLIGYFLKQDPDRWIRKQDIQEETTVNHESIRMDTGSGDRPGILENFGIIERSSWDAPMPRYKLCESSVVEFLQAYEGYPFTVFFTTAPRYQLFMFFVTRNHGTTAYTRSGLNDNLGISYGTVDDMMDHLQQAGIVTADDNGYSVEYQFVPESKVEQDVAKFNNLLYDEFTERTDDYPDDVTL